MTGSGTLPCEGRVIRGRLLGFDPRLGWGRVLGEDRRLYVVRADGFADGCPPAGTHVEFQALAGLRMREARCVRAFGAGHRS